MMEDTGGFKNAKPHIEASVFFECRQQVARVHGVLLFTMPIEIKAAAATFGAIPGVTCEHIRKGAAACLRCM
jgi:hypothetical protein